jgi:uncharacterized membrane protein (DUF441 family)
MTTAIIAGIGAGFLVAFIGGAGIAYMMLGALTNELPDRREMLRFVVYDWLGGSLVGFAFFLGVLLSPRSVIAPMRPAMARLREQLVRLATLS